MKIKTVVIEPIIEVKIYKKHKVTTKEIKLVLEENKPIFRKVGGKQYMAVGLFHRYLTIFFICVTMILLHPQGGHRNGRRRENFYSLAVL